VGGLRLCTRNRKGGSPRIQGRSVAQTCWKASVWGCGDKVRPGQDVVSDSTRRARGSLGVLAHQSGWAWDDVR
jgi:hypothetical protein